MKSYGVSLAVMVFGVTGVWGCATNALEVPIDKTISKQQLSAEQSCVGDGYDTAVSPVNESDLWQYPDYICAELTPEECDKDATYYCTKRLPCQDGNECHTEQTECSIQCPSGIPTSGNTEQVLDPQTVSCVAPTCNDVTGNDDVLKQNYAIANAPQCPNGAGPATLTNAWIVSRTPSMIGDPSTGPNGPRDVTITCKVEATVAGTWTCPNNGCPL